MNPRRISLLISLAMHGAFLALVYGLSLSFAQTGKPVRIDFTLLDSPAGPPLPKPPGPAAPQKARPQPKPAENRPRVAATAVPKPLPQAPLPAAPATEKAGPVPIAAASRAAAPPIAAPAAQGTSVGGQTTVAKAGGGGGGGGEGGADQLRSRYRKEQFDYIRRIIQEHVSYPPRAQRNGWQGRVVVLFSVLENGRVRDIRIRKSSGYEILDENVIETIRKVEPFPRPPICVELVIPVAYNL